MKRISVLLTALSAALFLTACSPQAVQETICDWRLAEAANKAAPQVVLDIQEPTVINTESRSQISARLNHAGTEVEHNLAMGLTQAQYQHESVVSFTTLQTPLGVCAVAQPKVTLALKDLQVSIAKDFKQGSCRYGEVLFHEMRHVQIYEQLLKETAEKVKAKLAMDYPTGVIHTARSVDGLQAKADRYVEETLVPFISNELSVIRERQDKLDTPQEYLRLTYACPKEPLPVTPAP